MGSPYLLQSEILVKAGPCSPESTARLESCVSGNREQQQRSACNPSRRLDARMSTANGARIASRSVHNMVLATEAFVKSQVAALSHDASHDWRYFQPFSASSLAQPRCPALFLTHCLTIRCSHIDRVRKMALVLAKEEGDAVSLDTTAYASEHMKEKQSYFWRRTWKLWNWPACCMTFKTGNTAAV